MKTIDRGRIVIAGVLIVLGILFLVLNLIPGFNAGLIWPVLIFLVGLAALLPPFLWPQERRGLAGFFIPGVILAVLGLFLFYNVLARDWASWAYGWLLIPAALGLGLALASWVGGWGPAAVWVGVVILVVSLLIFTIFALIFGGTALKIVGPAGLIITGLILLLHRPG